MSTLLDTLCPMHAVLDATGHILHAGPTLHKIHAGRPIEGQRFLEVLELRRPRACTSMAGLRFLAGQKLHLRLRQPPHTGLKGVLAPLPDDHGGNAGGGAIVDLSFGISVAEAVRDFALTGSDFAATDLTVEMLYLVEAKSAAMEASRKLNARLQEAMLAAEEQAFTDTLTGLANRRAIAPVLDRLIENGRNFVLMALDLDFFKQVNDTMGHAAGDHVLGHVARIMVAETRADDTVIRTGGDEFLLICPGITDRMRVADIAARLIARLEEPISIDGVICRISGSIGAAMSRDHERPDPARLVQDADLALYTAKDRGRGCHVIHPAMADKRTG